MSQIPKDTDFQKVERSIEGDKSRLPKVSRQKRRKNKKSKKTITNRCHEVVATPSKRIFRFRSEDGTTHFINLDLLQSVLRYLIKQGVIKRDPLKLLLPCQQKAINVAIARGRAESYKAISCIISCQDVIHPLQRYILKDIRRTAEYLAYEAPIIIHLKPENKMLSKIASDTHYRNLFETDTSGGSTKKHDRKIWEKNAFDDAYKDAEGDDRPKYGVLNTVNDKKGIQLCCNSYGDSYLVLKNTPELRMRCTFSDRDTSWDQPTVVSCKWEHMIPLMFNFSQEELDEVMQVALGDKENGSSMTCTNGLYKEVQIHGQLPFKDFSHLVLNPMYYESLTKTRQNLINRTLKKINTKHGIEIQWMED